MEKLNQKARKYLRDKGFSEEQIESGEWKDLINQADDLAEVEDAPAIVYPTGPAIVADMPNEVYHAGDGTSKSTLWGLEKSKTPAHFKCDRDNPKPKTPQQKNDMDIGTAIHTAVLEPHLFEDTVVRGTADRRGKKWTNLVEAYPDKIILLDSDYDSMQQLRDKVHADPLLSPILGCNQNLIENSAFWIDEETGMLCKCRVDLFNPENQLAIDIKSTKDATDHEMSKIMGDLGYHAQEAWYRDGWENAGGLPMIGWVFLVIERDKPFEFRLLELPPEAVEAGRATIHELKRQYHEFQSKDHWPGYERAVEEIDLKPWHYKRAQQEAA